MIELFASSASSLFLANIALLTAIVLALAAVLIVVPYVKQQKLKGMEEVQTKGTNFNFKALLAPTNQGIAFTLALSAFVIISGSLQK